MVITDVLKLIKEYDVVLGLILGGLITIFVQNATNVKESKIRITEQIINKRITAYEEFYNKIKHLRNMKLLKIDEDEVPEKKIVRSPCVIESIEIFNTYFNELNTIFSNNNQWFNTDLIREYNFLQDYSMNIYTTMQKMNDKDYSVFGVIVKQDFINICMEFDKIILKYFGNDIYNKHYHPQKNEWHKYKRKITDQRFEKTEFIIQKDKINSLLIIK